MPDRGAGWGWPGAARKAHYFEAGEVVSLCGKWMYTGTLTGNQGPPGGPDDCKECTRRLTIRQEEAARGA